MEGYYLGDGLPAASDVRALKPPTAVKLSSLSSETRYTADSITVRLQGRYSLTGAHHILIPQPPRVEESMDLCFDKRLESMHRVLSHPFS